MNQRSVTISGIGIFGAVGSDKTAFLHRLQEGRTAIKGCSLGDVEGSTIPQIGAILDDFIFESNFWPDEKIQEIRRLPMWIQAATIATNEAWHDARLNERNTDPNRIGIIVAGNNTMGRYQYDLTSQFGDHPEYLSPRFALQFLDTDYVGELSELFNIKGFGKTVGGAMASGTLALIDALHLLRLNVVDVCIVVGALPNISPMQLHGFYNIGALGGENFVNEPIKACRPFDKDADGFIYGQSCGCMILENKVEGYGQIVGGAVCLDGNHLSDPNAEGETRVMQMALNDAEISPEKIQYVNAHATSSPKGDRTEAEAIRRIFNDVWVNATKSISGHCLWSAGIIEAIATILQMKHNFLHPNLNLENPVTTNIQFVGKESAPYNFQYALSNSFGFGGINSSIVIKKGDR